jgi:transposase
MLLRPGVVNGRLRNYKEENPMNETHYIGFDVHKKSVSFCVKTASGEIVQEGKFAARREALRSWAAAQPAPWHGGMEATLFSAWIYDTLKPYTSELAMGHPARMKAITAGKKKSDRLDARTLADLLRSNLFPACYVLSPEMRELRRLLRYRHLVVRQSVRLQNKMAGLLMEAGAPFVKSRLQGKKYFAELVERLLAAPLLQARVERLSTIRGVGPITALTWALEIADPFRFSSIAQALSYCGLTTAFRSSADQTQRGPLSKQRNAWLQSTLIEAAKLAPRWNPQLAAVHEKELTRGHRNRATLQVARKLVAYLMAVDKSGQPFQERSSPLLEESITSNRQLAASCRAASLPA